MYFGWCSAFRLSPNHSYPRRKTSIQCSGSALATVSVLLQVLHQVYGFLYRTHRMLYIHFRNRPIQSIFQQQSLEAHKRIFPLPVVWLIPCGNYGQLLTVELTLYRLLEVWRFHNHTPFPLWSEKYVSLFPHHICTAGCDLLQNQKILYVIKKTKCVCSQNASKRIGNKKASILNCQFVFIVEITRRGSYAFFNWCNSCTLWITKTDTVNQPPIGYRVPASRHRFV